jgi:hypothetical protein
MRSSGLVFLILPVVAGCLPPPVYKVQRSVRVPHATVPLRTAQPLAGPVEITLGASNAADVVKPRRGDDTAAIEVPQRQVRGELRIRLRTNGELALIHERGIGASSLKLDSTQAPIGDGSPYGTGFAYRYAIRGDRGLVVGIEAEALFWQLPYVEYRTCVENCEGSATLEMDRGTAHESTLGFGVTPSYQLGDLTVFGGGFVRNHPTIERKGTEIGYTQHEDVSGGNMNLLLHAGVAYRFAEQFTALLVVDQNVTVDPVRYGPGIGFALSASLR